jgi:arsenite oxidase small subunit
MERRNFLKISATSAMAVAIAPSLITQKLYAEDGSLFQTFEKTQLKDAEGNPLKASTLVKEQNYVFMYPHAATPAILVDLPEPTQKDVKLKAEDGTEYLFKGGAGAKGTIVAYSAICQHQLTHPTEKMTMFQYVPTSGKTLAYDKAGVFVCTSHLAAYDPNQGGKVVGGPAKQGLAQIVLEVDADDNIWAVAVLGPSKFQEFFDAFKQELKEVYGRRGAKKLVKDEIKVQKLENFTKEIIQA